MYVINPHVSEDFSMKLQQLEYVIAIAQAGSITAAAKNLYQAQPNISIALKELESEINMQIFWRTPNGMVLTPEGENFLLRAKDIVESMHSLEAEYTNRPDDGVFLKIATGISSCVSVALCQWIENIPHEEKVRISLKEASTNSIIDEICNGKADIGIFRVPESQLEMYKEQIGNRRLSCSVLATFQMCLLLNKDHPLASRENITFDDLADYTEITNGDDEMDLFGRTFVNPEYDSNKQRKRIRISEMGSRMIILDTLKGAYMWASPVLTSITRYDSRLVRKECGDASTKVCDLMVCKKSNESNRVIQDFMNHFTEFINQLKICANK